MRSWLTYIFLLMVACGTVLTSCSDVLSEEGLGTCDDRTTVRLTISFGGDDDPMSRDVGSDSAPEDDDLDETTPEQAVIDGSDVYALVVDAKDNFLYRIEDLHITAGPVSDGYYTRTLEGTMIQTSEQVRIVLLANLKQNNIQALTNTTPEAFIDTFKDQDVENLYNQLIYNYDGTTTPWTVTGENARRIPMWGQSQLTTVPPTPGLSLDCYLYRAVAKVQIWVDKKTGIQSNYGDFIINKIIVNKANDKGYCVHVANEQPGSDIDVQYTTPKVPSSVETQNIVYNVANADSNNDGFNDAREAFSDMIYLPEQDIEEQGLTITIEYEFAGKFDSGTITFEEDVIRNHSYIFNINKNVNGEIVVNYCVTDWEEKNIDVPSFN